MLKLNKTLSIVALAMVLTFTLMPLGLAAAAPLDYAAPQTTEVDIYTRYDTSNYAGAQMYATSVTTATIDQDTLDSLSDAMTGSINNIFVYAVMIIGPLMAVAAIGIGFKFGGRLVEWVGDMIGGALH